MCATRKFSALLAAAAFALAAEARGAAGFEPVPEDRGGFLGLFAGMADYAPDSGLPLNRFAPNDAIAWAHLAVVRLGLVAPEDAWLAVDAPRAAAEGGVWSEFAELRRAGVRMIEPTRLEILEALAEISERARSRRLPVFVTLAAHSFVEDGRIWVLPEDWNAALRTDTAIPLDRFHAPRIRGHARNFLCLDLFPDDPVLAEGTAEADEVLAILRRIESTTVVLPSPLGEGHPEAHRAALSYLAGGMDWALREGAAPHPVTGRVYFPEIFRAASDRMERVSQGRGPYRPLARVAGSFADTALAFDPSVPEGLRRFAENWRREGRSVAHERLAWAVSADLIDAEAAAKIRSLLEGWERDGDFHILREHALYLTEFLHPDRPAFHSLFAPYWRFVIASSEAEVAGRAARPDRTRVADAFRPAAEQPGESPARRTLEAAIRRAERALIGDDHAGAVAALREARALVREHGLEGGRLRIETLQRAADSLRQRQWLDEMERLSAAGDFNGLGELLGEALSPGAFAAGAADSDRIEFFEAQVRRFRNADRLWRRATQNAEAGNYGDAVEAARAAVRDWDELGLYDRVVSGRTALEQWAEGAARAAEQEGLLRSIRADIAERRYLAANERINGAYEAAEDVTQLDALRDMMAREARAYYLDKLEAARRAGDFRRLESLLNEAEDLAALRVFHLGLTEEAVWRHRADLAEYLAAGRAEAAAAEAVEAEDWSRAAAAMEDAAGKFRSIGLADRAAALERRGTEARGRERVADTLAPLLAEAREQLTAGDYAAAARRLDRVREEVSTGIEPPAVLESGLRALEADLEEAWSTAEGRRLAALREEGDYDRLRGTLAEAARLFARRGWDEAPLRAAEEALARRDRLAAEWSETLAQARAGGEAEALEALRDGLAARLAAAGLAEEARRAEELRTGLEGRLDRRQRQDEALATAGRMKREGRYEEAWALLARVEEPSPDDAGRAGRWEEAKEAVAAGWRRHAAEAWRAMAAKGEWDRLRDALARAHGELPFPVEDTLQPFRRLLEAADALTSAVPAHDAALRGGDLAAAAALAADTAEARSVLRDTFPNHDLLRLWEDRDARLTDAREARGREAALLDAVASALERRDWEEAGRRIDAARSPEHTLSAETAAALREKEARFREGQSADVADRIDGLLEDREWAVLRRRVADARGRVDAGELDISELRLIAWERAVGDWEVAETAYFEARRAWEAGDPEEALRALERAGPLYEELGDEDGRRRTVALGGRIREAEERSRALAAAVRRVEEYRGDGRFREAWDLLGEVTSMRAGGEAAADPADGLRRALLDDWRAEIADSIATAFAGGTYSAAESMVERVREIRAAGIPLFSDSDHAGYEARLRQWHEARLAAGKAEELFAEERWQEARSAADLAAGAIAAHSPETAARMREIKRQAVARGTVESEAVRSYYVDDLVLQAQRRIEEQLRGDRRFTAQGGRVWRDWIAALRENHADALSRDVDLAGRLDALEQRVREATVRGGVIPF